jgi:phosphinothricin acetyltransferase
VRVRDATPGDLPAIREIYARAAETTPATFDFTGPSLAWWEEVLADEEHLLLVATGDDGVLGYARTSQHKVKPAYATTCETSVYVAEAARGRGVTAVGTFHSVGVKFGRAWDVRWYERSLRRR